MELFSYQQNPTPYGTIRHPTYRDPLNSYLNAEIFRCNVYLWCAQHYFRYWEKFNRQKRKKIPFGYKLFSWTLQINYTNKQKSDKMKQNLSIRKAGQWCLVCCAVAQSHLTLCDPMDCSTPDSSVLCHYLEFAQTHAHWVDFAIQPSHLLLPSIFPSIRVSRISICHRLRVSIWLQVELSRYLEAMCVCSDVTASPRIYI